MDRRTLTTAGLLVMLVAAGASLAPTMQETAILGQLDHGEFPAQDDQRSGEETCVAQHDHSPTASSQPCRLPSGAFSLSMRT